MAKLSKSSKVTEIAPSSQARGQLIPLMLNPIRAGFPNPAEDPVDQMIDFNSLIIKHPAATFALKVEGDSMEGAGVYAGDIVIVDRSLEAKHRDIVVATLDGDFTLKYLQKMAGQTPKLVAANPRYAPIDLEQTQEANIWGVVTHCIHGFIEGKRG